MSLCGAAGGADGHCRPNKRHPRTAPDPDGDGAEAGPLTSESDSESALPPARGWPGSTQLSVSYYSVEYSNRRPGQTC